MCYDWFVCCLLVVVCCSMCVGCCLLLVAWCLPVDVGCLIFLCLLFGMSMSLFVVIFLLF